MLRWHGTLKRKKDGPRVEKFGIICELLSVVRGQKNERNSDQGAGHGHTRYCFAAVIPPCSNRFAMRWILVRSISSNERLRKCLNLRIIGEGETLIARLLHALLGALNTCIHVVSE